MGKLTVDSVLTFCTIQNKMSNMTNRIPEQQLLLEPLQQITEGPAQTLAPFCEVMVHGLPELRRAMQTVAAPLGVSRASVYRHAK